MKCYYDFHIHSCLSPCASDDMTPNNIVNMAHLKGLDMIAITDHNSAKNVMAIMEVAKKLPLKVIGGMEITTSEEIHMVVIYNDYEKLMLLDEKVNNSIYYVKNNPDIFGNQIIMDKDDNIVGYEDKLLINASSLDVFTLYEYVKSDGGIIFPAHIDKSSFSIISNLGFIPKELKFDYVEVKTKENKGNFGDDYGYLSSSDAHFLWDISEREEYIEQNSSIAKYMLYNM